MAGLLVGVELPGRNLNGLQSSRTSFFQQNIVDKRLHRLRIIDDLKKTGGIHPPVLPAASLYVDAAVTAAALIVDENGHSCRPGKKGVIFSAAFALRRPAVLLSVLGNTLYSACSGCHTSGVL